MNRFFKAAMIVAAFCLAACSSNDEPKPPLALKWLESDSIALRTISVQLQTNSGSYPVPWSVEDRSTWKDIKLGRVVIDKSERETESDSLALAVVEFTMYLPESGEKMPMWLLKLKYLDKLAIYARPGAIVRPNFIPYSLKSLLIDRMGPEDDGYILLDSLDSPDQRCLHLDHRMVLDNIEVHGVDMTDFSFSWTYNSKIDLSHNQLSGEVPPFAGSVYNQMNLSHNKYTKVYGGWKHWIQWTMNESNINGSKWDFFTHPNLQYNEIEDFRSAKHTKFWYEYENDFIGNPGYSGY